MLRRIFGRKPKENSKYEKAKDQLLKILLKETNIEEDFKKDIENLPSKYGGRI